MKAFEVLETCFLHTLPSKYVILRASIIWMHCFVTFSKLPESTSSLKEMLGWNCVWCCNCFTPTHTNSGYHQGYLEHYLEKSAMKAVPLSS